MTEVFRAVVLGLVQGLTEFIPVSSSAHLVLVPYLASWEQPGLAFDVALHCGTLVAVVVYFRSELAATALGLLGRDRSPDGLLYRRIGLLLAAASVPVAVVGLIFEDEVGKVFESPLATSGLLLVTALLLVVGERLRDRRVARGARVDVPAAARAEAPTWSGDWKGTAPAPPSGASPTVARLPVGTDPTDPAGTSLQGVGLRHALLIGLAQCVALLPGVSRSGATITAGLATGLTREAATRFSFLLSLPALVGAGILKSGDLLEPGLYSASAIAAGVLAAFVSGYLAIRFLVALVARDRLTGFAYYCVFAAAVGAVGYAQIGPP